MPENSTNTTFGAFLWAVKGHWVTLVSGCTVIVLVGIVEKVSGKNIPLSVYFILLALLFCSACYLAWRDERRKQASLTGESFNRYKQEFLAERLRGFLNRDDALDFEDLSNIRQFTLRMGETLKIKEFLEKYYDPETVKQFNERGMSVLEELLADCYRSDEQRLNKRNTKSLDSRD